MTVNRSIPAAAYLRRSTDKQEQSLGDQRKEVQRWAAANGHDLITEYVDDAISGTTTKGRPGFQQMIADAEARNFEAIIVWSSDRFSRADTTETEHYRYRLREAGVVIHSVTEDFVSREGFEGDVMRVFRQNMNREFSVSLSKNTLRGQISSVLDASDPGRMPPYGYDREVVGPDGAVMYVVRFREGGDRDVLDRNGVVTGTYRQGQSLRKPGKECTTRLVLSTPERVRTVQDIFQMCVDGVGFKGIADELNRRGVMSPRGKLWQFTTVKALLENPAYRGDLVWNRRTEAKFYTVSEKRAERQRPRFKSGRVEPVKRADWIVVENTVPAIVERAMWEKAQSASEARSACKHGCGHQTNRWLLSGVMRCTCGQKFWGARKKKGVIAGRKSVVTAYYMAQCAHGGHVRAEPIEALVLKTLQSMVLGDQAGVAEAVDRFVQATLAGRGDGRDLAPLNRELSGIDGTVAALLNNLDPANLALVNDKLTQLRRRKEAIQTELRAAVSGQSLDEAGLRKWATERLGLLAETVAGRRDEKARRLLGCYVDELVVNPESKTGYLVLNAAASAATQAPATQKTNNPPGGGSSFNPIAGGCYGDRRHFSASPRAFATMSIRAVFWAHFNEAA